MNYFAEVAVSTGLALIGALLVGMWASLGKRLDKINGCIGDLQRAQLQHGDRITVGEQQHIATLKDERQHDVVIQKILLQVEELTKRVSELSSHCVRTHNRKIGK